MPHVTNIKGEQGCVVLGTTTTSYDAGINRNDDLTGFTVVEEATLDGITAAGVADAADLIGVTLIAGLFVPGIISAISVDSGLIVGIRGSRESN